MSGQLYTYGYSEDNLLSEGYYMKHVSAMTKEKLHHKADIAAELAYRDTIITALVKQIDQLIKQKVILEEAIYASRVERWEESNDREHAAKVLEDSITALEALLDRYKLKEYIAKLTTPG